MITIKLPIKALKDPYSQSQKDAAEDDVYKAVDDWLERNLSFKAERINIAWNSYFDIQGKRLPPDTPEYAALYKAVKEALWKK